MVATLLFMQSEDLTLGSPPTPPANAMEAQKAALAAQLQAEEAQKTAIVMQAEEAGLPPPVSDIEKLRLAAADDKLIKHASQ